MSGSSGLRNVHNVHDIANAHRSFQQKVQNSQARPIREGSEFEVRGGRFRWHRGLINAFLNEGGKLWIVLMREACGNLGFGLGQAHILIEWEDM